ncbi:hypothetical protein [Burkholderia pyrrocinia]|uniref:hypothetical protein n=1 Tax=Burkholderia pyrrocinia TaxID=60550 RepID=UPI001051B610|nr:hypothetical protein [Burkholderia pyrrocinia]TDA42961.1 hypothetical protein EVG18_34915 [Burkholderia pyrrocinia]
MRTGASRHLDIPDRRDYVRYIRSGGPRGARQRVLVVAASREMAMNKLHSCSSLSSLFERFHRKARRISDAVGPPMTRACRRLMDSLASAWSAVRSGMSHTHRH